MFYSSTSSLSVHSIPHSHIRNSSNQRLNSLRLEISSPFPPSLTLLHPALLFFFGFSVVVVVVFAARARARARVPIETGTESIVSAMAATVAPSRRRRRRRWRFQLRPGRLSFGIVSNSLICILELGEEMGEWGGRGRGRGRWRHLSHVTGNAGNAGTRIDRKWATLGDCCRAI